MKNIILHTDLLASPQPTGVETFLRRLVQGILKHQSGHFRYWVWRGGEIVPLDDGVILSKLSGHRHRWSYFSPTWEYPRWTTLPSELKNALVFEPHYFIHQKRLPTVTYIHDLSCIDRATDHPWYRVFKHKCYLPRVLKESMAIMVHTRFVRDRLLHHWPQVNPEKIHVVPGGIDPDEMQMSGLKKRQKKILILSTQEPRKGVADVLSTLITFLDSHEPWEVWMVGKAGWKIQKQGKHPRVKYLGYVSQDHLKKFLGDCGVLLYPSFYEGFGLPVLEALSVGCPCIIRDIPALSEWVPNSVARFNAAADLFTVLEKGVRDGFPAAEFPQKFLLKPSVQRFEESLARIY